MADTAQVLHTESIGTGPSLVILHGLFGSGENWRHQANLLASDFTVHRMDARNHGRSPHTQTISYPAMAADVIATSEFLHIKKFHLLGHSMGGKTAMQIALTYPQLVDKLIIVDIGPRRYAHHHDRILDGLMTLTKSPPESRKTADEKLASYVDDKFIRAFLLKNLQRTDSGTYQLRINIEAIKSNYPNIAAAITAGSHYQSYRRPTLFIKGAESDYLQSSDRRSVLNLFPRALLETIDGAGHWPHSEKPDVVFNTIVEFLQ